MRVWVLEEAVSKEAAQVTTIRQKTTAWFYECPVCHHSWAEMAQEDNTAGLDKERQEKHCRKHRARKEQVA